MGRTKNSIRNIKTALVCQSAWMLMGFISRKIFIMLLSAEYLGLNGLFSNILSMLTLAELGVGGAIVFSLYKPIAENDIETIKSLMRLYKRVYITIGSVVVVTGASLSAVLEVFVKEMPDMPFIRLYYIMYVVDTGMSYFFTYKWSLIIANQRRYIVDLYVYSFSVILDIAQIVALILTRSFMIYLSLRVLKSFLLNIFLSRKADRLYPYLKDRQLAPLSKEMIKTITSNVYAMLCHRIGKVVVNGTDNILIAKLVGLVEVGVYSNYLLIKTVVNTVTGRLFQSVTASLGNLNVQAGSAQKAEFFNRLSFACAWIHGFCAICLMALYNPFIELWIGEEYLFELPVVFLIVLNFYITGMRVAVSAMRDVSGLFWNDRYSPLCEAVINLIASVFLGTKLGISGVFIGTFISTITTCFWTEPYVVYKHCLRVPLRHYFIRYGIYTTVTLAAAVLTLLLCRFVTTPGIAGFILKIAICAVVPNAIFLAVYFRTENFRYFRRLFMQILYHY